MKLASLYKIPVTPMGARTGLSGGALPVFGGIGLSMERFDRILRIDERNHQVTVQPGVITQVLQEAVAEKACFIRLILPAEEVVSLAEMWLKTPADPKQ